MLRSSHFQRGRVSLHYLVQPTRVVGAATVSCRTRDATGFQVGEEVLKRACFFSLPHTTPPSTNCEARRISPHHHQPPPRASPPRHAVPSSLLFRAETWRYTGHGPHATGRSTRGETPGHRLRHDWCSGRCILRPPPGSMDRRGSVLSNPTGSMVPWNRKVQILQHGRAGRALSRRGWCGRERGRCVTSPVNALRLRDFLRVRVCDYLARERKSNADNTLPADREAFFFFLVFFSPDIRTSCHQHHLVSLNSLPLFFFSSFLPFSELTFLFSPARH